MEKKRWTNSIGGGKAMIGALTLSLALIVGCVTTRMYTGEALPKEEIAVIYGSRPLPDLFSHKGVGVRFLMVDDQVVKQAAKDKARYQRIEVMPGRHKMLIETYGFGSYPNIIFDLFPPVPYEQILEQQEFELNAEAGHEYKIKAKKWWKPGGFIVIEDCTTGDEISRSPLTMIFRKGPWYWPNYSPVVESVS